MVRATAYELPATVAQAISITAANPIEIPKILIIEKTCDEGYCAMQK
ncbi:MAG: hypothetical protein HOM01_12660 [Kordiimonadaceae bacterium]|nr:hypothetical protein [Kordiimonadaceae bacterium]